MKALKFILNRKIVEKSGQAFIFLSAVPKEGKTFTCLKDRPDVPGEFQYPKKDRGLWILISSIRKITDKMGNPRTGLGVKRCQAGTANPMSLTGVLATQAPSIQTCFFVPVGRMPSHGGDAATLSETFPKAMEALKDQFDLILVDGPSIMTSLATLTNTGLFDGVFIVVEAEKTRQQVVSTAIDHLKAADPVILGTIMNKRHHHIPGFIYKKIF